MRSWKDGWDCRASGFGRSVGVFNDRDRVVIVDGLEVFGFDAVPGDVGVGAAAQGDIADEVLDKHGVVVGALGDHFFVGPLENAIDFAGGGVFDQADEVLDPYGLAEADGEGGNAPLVVGAARADRAGAGAKGGDGHGHCHQKIVVPMLEGGAEAHLIIHKSCFSGGRGSLFDEEGKLEFRVGAIALEPGTKLFEDVADVVHVNSGAMRMQDFQKPAHVRAFEVMRQVHRKPHGGHGRLHSPRPIPHLDRIVQVGDAHAVNGQLPIVRLPLSVM